VATKIEVGVQVWVCLYTHRHGVDVGVYESPEAADKGVRQILVENAGEELEESDYKAVRELLDAGKLWEAATLYSEMTEEYIEVVNRTVEK